MPLFDVVSILVAAYRDVVEKTIEVIVVIDLDGLDISTTMKMGLSLDISMELDNTNFLKDI